MPGTLLRDTFADLHRSARALVRSPGFLALAVLSVTIGITISTLLFAILNGTILRPPAHVADADALVKVFRQQPGRPDRRFLISYPDYVELRDQATTLAGMVAAIPERGFVVRTPTAADRPMLGGEVSENYFDVLGIRMAVGRGFLPEDAASGWSVAVIGHGLWQRDFGGAPSALGQSVRVDGRAFTIIGVAPEGLGWLSVLPAEANVWIPIRPERRADPGNDALTVSGRRRAGASVGQVQAEFDAVAVRMAGLHPDRWASPSGEDRLAVLTELESRFPAGPRALPSLIVWMVFDAVILLIVCANVANLMLTRALRRRRDTAIRLALGCSRGRLVRAQLAESLLLFGAAGVLGLVLIAWLTELVAKGWGPLPTPVDITVDLRVVAFAFGITAAAGLVFGLAPALQALRTDITSALKGVGATDRLRRFGLRNVLVLGQVAGSVVLVVVSALLARDVRQAHEIDPGFDPTGVAVLTLDLSHRGLDAPRGRLFLDELTGRLRALAGVDSVAVAGTVPLSGQIWSSQGFEPEGSALRQGERTFAVYDAVSPGYFRLVGMPLVAGRDFAGTDGPDAPRVVVVNQAFARRYWPGQDPVGRRVVLAEREPPAEVVGIVADARYRRLNEEPTPHLWAPRDQRHADVARVHIRTRGNPAALFGPIRAQVRALDTELPIVDLGLMTSLTANATREQEVASMIFGGAGVLALFLAAVGIYGVMSFLVAQRTREMGIRIALGAHPARVVRQVVGESLALSSLGFAAGTLAAAAVAIAMRAVLLGISPFDPASYAISLAVLALVAAAASLVPAVRAARVDPVRSLRAE